MKVSVIIPAAGRSARFKGKQNKIFERIKGRPVFLRTLELFVNRDDVCQVLLVVHQDDLDTIKQRFGGNLGLMDVGLVVGGAERTDSVRNALAEVDDSADLVAVHDAARPCVSPLWIDAVFDAAAKDGAALLAYPVHGTLKKVAEVRPDSDSRPTLTVGGESFGPKDKRAGKRLVVDRTVPRSGLWEAQTPQVFRRALLVEAYARAEEAPATDDAQLVEALGGKLTVVMGDPRNVKITTSGVLSLATAVIDSLPRPKPKADGNPFAEAQW